MHHGCSVFTVVVNSIVCLARLSARRVRAHRSPAYLYAAVVVHEHMRQYEATPRVSRLDSAYSSYPAAIANKSYCRKIDVFVHPRPDIHPVFELQINP